VTFRQNQILNVIFSHVYDRETSTDFAAGGTL
jgi:hypothetical protein